MTLDDAIERYVAMQEEHKALFLLGLSWWLTVFLRGCYDEADLELRVTKLQGANEIQHHLASEAAHHLAGNPERYPDDVLIRACAETSTHYKIGGEFKDALQRVLNQFASKPTESVH